MAELPRLVFVSNNVPNTHTVGSPYISYTVITFLIQKGWKVKVLAILPTPKNTSENEQASFFTEILAQDGVDCETVYHKPTVSSSKRGFLGKIAGKSARLRKIIAPIDSDYTKMFETENIAEAAIPRLERQETDCLLIYDNAPVVALQNFRKFPKFALLGDPFSLALRARFAQEPFIFSREYLRKYLDVVQSRGIVKWIAKAAKKYEIAATYAAHEASIFRNHGVHLCFHQRVPWKDFAPADIVAKKIQNRTPLQIIMIGGLHANYGAIRILARQVLPVLEREGELNSFVFRLIGKVPQTMPTDVKEYLTHPQIRVLGFVEKIEPELQDADIILWPTPHPVGARSKIMNSMSFANAVVAEPTAQLGMPELIHGENSLIGKTGTQLAHHLLSLYKDRHLLRKLQVKARETYQNNYLPEIACVSLEKALHDMLKG